MSINVTEDKKDHFGIVIVDAEKFLRLWRSVPNGIHRAVANGSPKTWSYDYKYHCAVDGFSLGRENPVPLANVSYETATRPSVTHKFLWFGRNERQEQIQYISVDDITRTIWLLTQGCVAFPVKCGISSAHELFRVAGAAGTSFHTVGELAELAPHA